MNSTKGYKVLVYDENVYQSVHQDLLSGPDELLDAGVLYKIGRRGHSAKISLSGHDYFLKKYYAKPGIYRLVDLFRGSRGINAWRVNIRLIEEGVPVPKPLVFFQESCCGIWQNGYILMEFIDGLGDLRKVWGESSRVHRDELTVKLAGVIGALHGHHFIHGDLKWYNILCVRDGSGMQVVLSDLDGAKKIRFSKRRAIQRDLDRLLADFSEVEDGARCRELFLKHYAEYLAGQARVV